MLTSEKCFPESLTFSVLSMWMVDVWGGCIGGREFLKLDSGGSFHVAHIVSLNCEATDCGNKASFCSNEAVNLKFQYRPNTVKLAFSSAA